MDILLKELQQNEAVLSIQKKESVLGNLSYMEEALLLAADYRQKPQKLLIIKNNAYTAQKLYERLQALLGDEVLLFSLEESLRVDGGNGKAAAAGCFCGGFKYSCSHSLSTLS